MTYKDVGLETLVCERPNTYLRHLLIIHTDYSLFMLTWSLEKMKLQNQTDK